MAFTVCPTWVSIPVSLLSQVNYNWLETLDQIFNDLTFLISKIWITPLTSRGYHNDCRKLQKVHITMSFLFTNLLSITVSFSSVCTLNRPVPQKLHKNNKSCPWFCPAVGWAVRRKFIIISADWTSRPLQGRQSQPPERAETEPGLSVLTMPAKTLIRDFIFFLKMGKRSYFIHNH